MSLLTLNVAQKVIASKALRARNRIQETLRPYYIARYFEGDDVSDIIKGRAHAHAALGVSDPELGDLELSLPWVATTNTIPVLFWLFVHVFSRPDYVEKLRIEAEGITSIQASAEGSGRTATIDITKLEKHSILLMAIYREVLRVYSDNVSNRRVLRDTCLRDADGQEYLLKKDSTVQWTTGVPHLDSSNWGLDVTEFNPERWIDPSGEDEKKRRIAMIPFGGGKNLCPGRKFALTENLGFISALSLGFEVDGAKVPRAESPYMGSAIRRPAWDGMDPSLRIRRREGWEDVVWAYSC